MGIQEGSPCETSVQCDVGLGCYAQSTFPFMTMCQPLLTQGQSCKQTFDCAQGLICWPLTPKDAVSGNMTCVPAFSQPQYGVIGYVNNASMTDSQNALNAGLTCQTGIATKINATAAMCVSIAKVTTNLDNYVAS